MRPKPRPKPRSLRPDTLLSSVAILLLVSIVQRSIGFGRGVLLCRWLQPEELGLWEMSYGFLLLAAPLAVLGLPGCFGRYLSRFSEQGQLRMFLRRTTVWTFGVAAFFVGLIAWQAPAFASIAFGDPVQAPLMRIVAVCLAAMITHHFLEAVFAGLRLFRVVSFMHFCQSLLFAAFSLLLVACWRGDAASIVIGYAAACGVSILSVASWALWRVVRKPDGQAPMRHREFWSTLMAFAIWVWVTHLLTNVFSTVDRYMILHYGGFDRTVALEMIGNYHASIIVPLLLTSVATLLAGALIPHLSRKWEVGQRHEVAERMNLTLKLTAIGMLAVGCGVLLLSPLLFGVAFEGKYNAGLQVLPWTLTACLWHAMLLISQAYIWCAEKTRSATLPLIVGIASNVLLNLLLLPVWGLTGAVAATTIATLLAYATQMGVNRLTGMHLHQGTLLLSLTPALLLMGVVPALIALALATWSGLARDGLFTAKEREDIWTRVDSLVGRIGIGSGGAANADTSGSPTA